MFGEMGRVLSGSLIMIGSHHIKAPDSQRAEISDVVAARARGRNPLLRRTAENRTAPDGKVLRRRAGRASETVTVGSESEVRPQLNDAQARVIGRRVGNGTGGAIGQYAARVANVRVWVVVVSVIERVIRVGPDFQSYRLVNRKLFCQADVHVRKPRSDKRVASIIAEGPIRRVGVGGRVEPLVDCRMRHFRVTD